MKKWLLITLFCVLFLPSVACAQVAQIIDVKGKVHYRKDAASDWKKAEIGLFLGKESEVKTGSSGSCVISFDRENDNIITLKNDTQTKIESIKPGAVQLPKGRVFSIIRDLEQIENFEVKTPTAVGGARGTAWLTEYVGGVTSISVFEDNVFVSGLDENGFAVSTFDVKEEFAASIPRGGYREGDIKPVSEDKKSEWNDTTQTINKALKEHSERQRETKAGRKGPGPASHDVIEMMKASGEYSEAEIQAMMEMMESGMENLSDDEMFLMMEIMNEMEMLTPEEEAMMQEVMENEEAIKEMSPEERDAYFQALEEKYGVQHDTSYDGTYYDPMTGETHTMTPEEEAMRQEIMANEEQIMQMSDEERYAYFQGLEDKYGVEGMYDQSHDPYFDEYMAQYGTPPPDGQYQYDSRYYDQYYGEFDKNWESYEGMYVGDEFYYHEQEYYETLTDDPYCECLEDCTLTYEQCPSTGTN